MDGYMARTKRKRLFVIILSICLLLSLSIVIFLKSFELKNISFEGNTRYSDEEMKSMLITEKLDSITPFCWLRFHTKGEQLIPFIEKIELRMTDRHSIDVRVYEKKVIGCVEVQGNYLYFDRDGLVVESSRRRLEDILQITGLSFSKIVLKEKLEVQREELFGTILNLVRLIEKHSLPVERIHFQSDYSVKLYADGSEVLLGKREYYDDVLAVLKQVLDSAGERKMRIDMTLYEQGNDRITAQDIVE